MTSHSTYPKIETLFDRDERFVVDTSRLRRPEFGLISEWVLTEKVDGTNVRVIFTRREGYYDIDYDVRGKTDSAQMPPQLLNTLRAWCEAQLTREVRSIIDEFGLTTSPRRRSRSTTVAVSVSCGSSKPRTSGPASDDRAIEARLWCLSTSTDEFVMEDK